MLKKQHNCDYVVPVKKRYTHLYKFYQKKSNLSIVCDFFPIHLPKFITMQQKKDTEIQTNVIFAISLVCLASAFMQKTFKKTSCFSMVCIRQTPIYNIIAIML